MKKWERKFITHPKIETITQSNTTKYVYLPNLSKCTGTGYQIFEPFTW